MTVTTGHADAFGRSASAAWLALGLSAAVAVVVVIQLADGDWGLPVLHTLYHWWVLGWLMAVTFGVRSMGLREVVRVWLLGFFVVYLLVWYPGTAIADVLGADSGLHTSGVVPALEELSKLAPIVFVVVLARRHLRWPTLSDFAVLGFASGAAFGLREDLLRDRIAAEGFSGLWELAFPSTLDHDGRLVLTHSGWTLLASVALGVLWTYRRNVLGWLVGVTLLALVVVDHALQNATGGWATFFERVLLDGWLPALLMVAAIVGVVVHDTLVLRRVAAMDRLTAPSSPFGVLERALRRPSALLPALQYQRLRTGGHMDSWRRRTAHRPQPDRSTMVRRLHRLDLARAAGTRT